MKTVTRRRAIVLRESGAGRRRCSRPPDFLGNFHCCVTGLSQSSTRLVNWIVNGSDQSEQLERDCPAVQRRQMDRHDSGEKGSVMRDTTGSGSKHRLSVVPEDSGERGEACQIEPIPTDFEIVAEKSSLAASFSRNRRGSLGWRVSCAHGCSPSRTGSSRRAARLCSRCRQYPRYRYRSQGI